MDRGQGFVAVTNDSRVEYNMMGYRARSLPERRPWA